MHIENLIKIVVNSAYPFLMEDFALLFSLIGIFTSLFRSLSGAACDGRDGMAERNAVKCEGPALDLRGDVRSVIRAR
jgi:hypothetical protein